MSDGEALDPDVLARQNRTLEKKLARVQKKLENLETLQRQQTNLMQALMQELDDEKAESERLLLNILPEPIAHRLKVAPEVLISDRFESASVLFSDIVGFTPLSEQLTAEEMVEWLNTVYSKFDELVQQHDVEKIRTIGDGYMVAAGVPYARLDHAQALAHLAIEMREHFHGLPPIHGHQAQIRIGINSGPLVGGVIGTHKFQYDIWGDTVNTAARMESHGVPGKIHISAATYEQVADRFVCERRGTIDVKGKGVMETWFIEGPAPSRHAG